MNRSSSWHRLVEPPLNPTGFPVQKDAQPPVRWAGRNCPSDRNGRRDRCGQSRNRSWLVLKRGCGDNQRELRKHLPAQAFAPAPLPLNFPSIKKSRTQPRNFRPISCSALDCQALGGALVNSGISRDPPSSRARQNRRGCLSGEDARVPANQSEAFDQSLGHWPLSLQGAKRIGQPSEHQLHAGETRET